ncbi:F-box domain-containing protein [Mycena venus]|uniref:F-box domain-containing protein n=1 Tax=Mycena venus TaxID=2733690 RepID=A0A8H6YKC4_9AGAR|nr:F-box domain-containing protein [Mycena venus]
MSIANTPTEVLLQIFHLAVAVNPLQLGSGTAVAFPISQVCHHWRHVALDSPALWDDVRFPRRAYKQDTPMLDELLARSRTRPLSVVFSYSELQGGQMIDFSPFFNKIKDVCHRIWAIYAKLPRYAMLQFSEILGHEIFPLLARLHIVQDDDLTPVAVTFENAPALAVLYVENITLCRNRSRSPRLDAQSQFVNISAPVMDRLHSLTIIRSPPPIFRPADHPPQIALTSLTLNKLSQGHHNFPLLTFLTSFHMPHLCHIELSIDDSRSHFSSQFIQALDHPAVYPALRSAKFTALSLSNITPGFLSCPSGAGDTCPRPYRSHPAAQLAEEGH